MQQKKVDRLSKHVTQVKKIEKKMLNINYAKMLFNNVRAIQLLNEN